MLLLIGVWVYFMRQMQGGGKGGAFSFGKSRARMLDEANNVVTFADVAGCDEAKEEVKELVDFLKDPQKFQKLGGRIPRGVLLVGPPPTGKTLHARAIAGEAKVPFFSISGSDFVEMFVGVGAARVRDMFEQAKKSAPCIIFVDEIDAARPAIAAPASAAATTSASRPSTRSPGRDGRLRDQPGRHRDGGDEPARHPRSGPVAAGSFRPAGLCHAARHPRPREQILNVHMRKVPIGTDVRADIIARGTPGFSGADLANLVNESALFAARRNGRVVEMIDFERAKDKIMMGAERKSMVMDEDERRNTAYHEAGHALISKLLPKLDPVHKVTIIPRGGALGVTVSLPEKDRYSTDKILMLSRISMLFGGRIAEEVFMQQMTTGASNDFERATAIARDMVTRYGMTDALGPHGLRRERGRKSSSAARSTKTTTMSEETMRKVDAEVRRIIDEQYRIARDLIELHQDKMHADGHRLAGMGGPSTASRSRRTYHARPAAASAEGLDAQSEAGEGGTGRVPR